MVTTIREETCKKESLGLEKNNLATFYVSGSKMPALPLAVGLRLI